MTHERKGESDEWYTPKYIFNDLGIHFDLDVAAPKGGPRYVPTSNWYSEGSLQKEWYGLVWMNPPFGNQANKKLWMSKFFEHNNGIALMPDRTSAEWYLHNAYKADVTCFVSPKVKFEREDGTIGDSPSTGTVLFSVGSVANKALLQSNLGTVVINKKYYNL